VRFPRVRFTVRWMMIAVAVVALLMYGRRVQQHRLDLAAVCGIADRGVRHTGAIYRLDYDTATLWTTTSETPVRTPVEIESRRRRASYWMGLKQKYVQAAAYPWLPVQGDPPPPEP
jgi:hypothetical protein